MGKELRRIGLISAALLALIYLIFFLSESHARATQICVLCLLAVSGWFASLTWVRKEYTAHINWKGCAVALVLAGVVLALGQHELLPREQEIELTLFASGQNEAATGGEIWLCEIKIGGEDRLMSEVVDYDAVGWEYWGENDEFVYFPGENDATNRLVLRVTGDDVTLCFAQNPWSGLVKVSAPGREEQLNLYCSDAKWERAEFQISTLDMLSGGKLARYIIHAAGALTTLTFIILALGAVFCGGLIEHWIKSVSEGWFRKYNTPLWIAFAHWSITTLFQIDRLFFQYENETPIYILVKLLYFLFLVAAWSFGFYVYREYRSGNTSMIRGVLIFRCYFTIIIRVLIHAFILQ